MKSSAHLAPLPGAFPTPSQKTREGGWGRGSKQIQKAQMHGADCKPKENNPNSFAPPPKKTESPPEPRARASFHASLLRGCKFRSSLPPPPNGGAFSNPRPLFHIRFGFLRAPFGGRGGLFFFRIARRRLLLPASGAPLRPFQWICAILARTSPGLY